MTVIMTAMIQLCCHMPPYVTSLSWSLVTPRSHLPSKRRLKQQAICWKGRRVCPSSMPYPTLQLRPVQSQFSIRCHQPLWLKPNLKILCWDLVIPYIHKGVKPKGSVIAKIRCKAAWKYLLQFDRLVLKQGVLHCIYISNDVETHQLVLPLEYHKTVLCMLHDDYGHQGLDQTLALVRERFYWSMMNHDATEYVTNCHQRAMLLRVITQVCIHNRGRLLPIIPWTCCVLIS